jgi:hypothetical protein
MARHHIDQEMSIFAHKNLSTASNEQFSIAMILLVLVTASDATHSIHATASAPDADTVFYRIDTSIRKLQDQFWKQSLVFLRKRRKKLSKVKCYLTVDETYDSYSGNLHKKPLAKLKPHEKKVRRYIHKYKPKRGDTGSFKYLAFALQYGKKKRVLRVKALRRSEPYWLFVAQVLKEIYTEVKFEAALLDRGFYVAELIDQLQKDGTPFVIRACLCDYMKKILGIYREWMHYEYAVADKAKTTLILGRDWRLFTWGFVTNMEFTQLEQVRFLYKKRWNIENVFKATDGIQIRAATSNHIARMFCVCLSFLIYNAWQRRNKRPTLFDHVKSIVGLLLNIIFWVCPYRDRFALNNPFWKFFADRA